MAGMLPQQEEEVPAEAPADEAAPADDVTQPESTGETPQPSGGRLQDDSTLDDDEEQPNVTPEEQAQYEEFRNKGYELIYSPEGGVNPGILKLLDNDPSDLLKGKTPEEQKLLAPDFGPIAALAGATVTLTLKLVESSQAAGHKFPDEIIYHAAAALLEDLAEIASGEKIHDYSQQEIQQAFIKGTQLYYLGAKAKGLIDDEEGLKAEFQQLKEADAQGPEALEALVPSLGQLASAGNQRIAQKSGMDQEGEQ